MQAHEGRFAAVTGAGSGNGKAIAQTLLREGATVAVMDIVPESLKDLTGEFAGAFAVTVDVADQTSVRESMNAIAGEFGRLDVLVNNAGIVRPGTFAELPREEWDEVFAVNSTGPFLMSQAAMPMLKAGAGRVVRRRLPRLSTSRRLKRTS